MAAEPLEAVASCEWCMGDVDPGGLVLAPHPHRRGVTLLVGRCCLLDVAREVWEQAQAFWPHVDHVAVGRAAELLRMAGDELGHMAQRARAREAQR